MLHTPGPSGGGNESVPPGHYIATYNGVELHPVKKGTPEEGVAYKWTFTITEDGDYRGRRITDLSDNVNPTTANKLGRLLCGLAGKPLAVGTQVDPKDYVGGTYMVIVAPNKAGKPAIYTISPAK